MMPPLPIIKWIGVGVAVASLATCAHINGKAIGRAAGDRAAAAAQRRLDAAVIKAGELAAEQTAKVVAAERRMAATQQEARNALDQERSRNDVLAQRWRAADGDVGRLRQQLAAYAAGGDAAGADSAAACQQRAAAIGDVLEACLREHRTLGGDLAAAAERHAAETRSLLAGWPR